MALIARQAGRTEFARYKREAEIFLIRSSNWKIPSPSPVLTRSGLQMRYTKSSLLTGDTPRKDPLSPGGTSQGDYNPVTEFCIYRSGICLSA